MKTKNTLIILILTLGTFGVLTTEMGVIGILPSLAEYYGIPVTKAALFVSVFALVVAFSGLILPILLSKFNRKKIMVITLAFFVIGNLTTALFSDFHIGLIARAIMALFQPVYVTLTLVVASSIANNQEQVRKHVSTVMMGVSAGMVLGMPIVSYIANSFSVQISILFIAMINILSFIATIIFIPTLPVKEKLSYGNQLTILRKPIVWVTFIIIVLMGSAINAPNSYMVEYLNSITHISSENTSIMLLIFGVASVFGNLLAGKLLGKKANKTIFFFPIILTITFILWFYVGKFTILMVIIIIIFGLLYSVAVNINQYLMTSAAPKAPDFANGLFISCTNWGVSLGTAVGGLFISGIGIKFILWAGVLFLVLTMLFILLRIPLYKRIN